MANVKISELATTTTSIGCYLPIVVSGVTKKIAAGAGGGLDADTVAGYGIGTVAKIVAGNTIDSLVLSGLYASSDFPPTPPWVGENAYILHIERNVTYATQIAFRLCGYDAPGTKIRVRNSTWGTWREIWNSYSDGNGGQPPAPKIRAQSVGFLIGELVSVHAADGADLFAPAPSGGSTWAVITIFGIDSEESGWRALYQYPGLMNEINIVSGGAIVVASGAHPGKPVRAFMIRQA